jgi:ribosomal-protein-alanine N-acetyltransferase
MIKTKIFDTVNKPSSSEKKEIIDFLHTHLQEYGDSKKDIEKAIDYSLKQFMSFGGFTLLLIEDNKIVGVTVINKTGMGDYIPENILVYIATHADYRGKGLGKRLMQKAIEIAKGDVALHVEADNPAKFLYEKMGFTNPYLEMRLKRN